MMVAVVDETKMDGSMLFMLLCSRLTESEAEAADMECRSLHHSIFKMQKKMILIISPVMQLRSNSREMVRFVLL